jgi:hypothetical protein
MVCARVADAVPAVIITWEDRLGRAETASSQLTVPA